MTLIDITVIIVYFLLMAGMGFYFMRRNRDADAYFKAGGRLPWWVVSLSIYATMFSSITLSQFRR
jgi:Na+/proline symporter